MGAISLDKKTCVRLLVQMQSSLWSPQYPVSWCAGVQTLRVPQSVSEQESVQVAITRLLVESYYDIVRASLQDSVPKAVMHFLVLFVQRGLQQYLIRTLYRWGILPLFMHVEPP